MTLRSKAIAAALGFVAILVMELLWSLITRQPYDWWVLLAAALCAFLMWRGAGRPASRPDAGRGGAASRARSRGQAAAAGTRNGAPAKPAANPAPSRRAPQSPRRRG